MDLPANSLINPMQGIVFENRLYCERYLGMPVKEVENGGHIGYSLRRKFQIWG
jgi:hypothetical protein